MYIGEELRYEEDSYRTIIENRQFPGAVDISTTPDVEVL